MFFEVHNDFVQEKEILAVGLSANECSDSKRRSGVGREVTKTEKKGV